MFAMMAPLAGYCPFCLLPGLNMVWFALCLVGFLSVLGVVPVPLQYVIIASGIALLLSVFCKSQMHRI